jgi:hypothetical protein
MRPGLRTGISFKDRRNPGAVVDHLVEVDAGLDAEAVQHVYDVLGGDVPEAPLA